MEYHAGIDVSLELSSNCVVDVTGKIIKEARVISDPAALVAFFDGLGFAAAQIGLEAGPLSQWLHTGLTRGGFETVLLETRHVKAPFPAMTVNNLERNISLTELAGVVHIGPSHFGRAFTRSVGNATASLPHASANRARQAAARRPRPVDHRCRPGNGLHSVQQFRDGLSPDHGATPREYRRSLI
jgi:AraC-like DNA-binding protein